MERETVGRTSYTEQEMRSAYNEKVNDLLLEFNQGKYDKDSILKVGLELECFVVKTPTEPVSEHLRDKITESLNKINIDSSCELGAAQIELKTKPIDLGANHRTDFITNYLAINNELNSTARNDGLSILRIGAIPTVSSADVKKTSQERYKTVPEFYNMCRKPMTLTKIGKFEKIEIGNADIVSLFSSIQLNIEAKSSEDAIDKLNRSFMLSPIITSISGNARFLDYHDTGFADVRMPAWQISHETRTPEQVDADYETRIGMPNKYFDNIEEYFTRIGQYPFILKDNIERAVPYTIGLNWQDVRIKVLENQKSLVVEFRPISTQPTPEEDLAVGLFYLGRLIWSQANDEPLTDAITNKRNKDSAMQDGINATFTSRDCDGNINEFKAYEILPQELKKAKAGLLSINYGLYNFNQLFSLLEIRIEERKTPSDNFAEKVASSKSSRKEAIIEAIYSSNLCS